MPNAKVYIYYSGATDKTGTALKEALDIEGGASAPKGKREVIIGWGAKTKEASKLSAAHVLNHPDHIRDNRNKLKSLQVMKNAGVSVADFVDAEHVMHAIDQATNPIKLPLVGRSKYHQGGKGFWLCMTKTQVQAAINEDAQYFQNYLPIVDEFRLHIFRGKLLYAQKKVRRKSEDMGAAFVEQYGDKVKALAEKKGQKIDDGTVTTVLEAMAKRVQPNPDMIVRSNMKGWKFSQVKDSNVNKALLDAAIAALTALKLDFGAVDCCTIEGGGVAIIEVNSGPGLQGTPFDAYVKAFKEVLSDILNPKKAAVAASAQVEKNIKTPVSKTEVAKNPGSAKARLAAQASLMTQLAEEATEEEAEALTSVWARVASKIGG